MLAVLLATIVACSPKPVELVGYGTCVAGTAERSWDRLQTWEPYPGAPVEIRYRESPGAPIAQTTADGAGRYCASLWLELAVPSPPPQSVVEQLSVVIDEPITDNDVCRVRKTGPVMLRLVPTPCSPEHVGCTAIDVVADCYPL